MNSDIAWPPLNGHSTGIIMKELVRRAIMAIRATRVAFEVNTKQGYDGSMDDVFTTADTRAQGIYVKSLRECFPAFGIIAEEDNVRIAATHPSGAYFTLDGVDGTKAFVRKQSHGIGTMIALVQGGRVVAAYIGDINTMEIFGFRPDGTKGHRISDFEIAEELKVNPMASYALLRDPMERVHSSLTARTVKGRFKNYMVDGSSIGTWFARLWKGECAGLFLPPGKETPWDSAPVVGISMALGYVFLRPTGDMSSWEQFEPVLSTEIVDRNHEMLVVHSSRAAQFETAMA